MMKSISSWCGGLERGACAASSLSSCRYPRYVIRSWKSVTTPSSRDMGALLPPCYRRKMRRAAFLLLAGCGCGSSAPPALAPAIAGLTTVSAAAPWPATCGEAGRSTVTLNSQVEPSVAIDPLDANHLIGAWQQDRWANGGAKGVVSATTFDGGHTWTRSTAAFTL